MLLNHYLHAHNEVKQPEEKEPCKEDKKYLFEAKWEEIERRSIMRNM